MSTTLHLDYVAIIMHYHYRHLNGAPSLIKLAPVMQIIHNSGVNHIVIIGTRTVACSALMWEVGD